jgi:hypothetical protein
VKSCVAVVDPSAIGSLFSKGCVHHGCWRRVAALIVILFLFLLWNGFVHMMLLAEANAAVAPRGVPIPRQ